MKKRCEYQLIRALAADQQAHGPLVPFQVAVKTCEIYLQFWTFFLLYVSAFFIVFILIFMFSFQYFDSILCIQYPGP